MHETHPFFKSVLLSFFICGACETTIKCIDNERFYRNPDLDNASENASRAEEECAKYYLCLEGEVFSFKCSPGLLFDVARQICDFNASVKNCHQFTGNNSNDRIYFFSESIKPVFAGLIKVVEHDNYALAQSPGLMEISLKITKAFARPRILFSSEKKMKTIFFAAALLNAGVHFPDSGSAADQCPDPNHRRCEDDERTCIRGDYFCDGASDCPDGSDETRCDSIEDPNAAVVCDPRKCQLPKCFCSGNGAQIPGGLDASDAPQMVLLTFEDSVNDENFDFYSYLFSQNYTNPNGCPITATFFVSHPRNNYYYVQKLWNAGHEIAVHSITHKLPDRWWSDNATLEDWFDEMVGGANILHKFSKVRLAEIAGVRAPFLRIGWNRQYLMMKEFGFAFDSSVVAPFSQTPLWPYTFDYKMPHKCYRQRCPTRSYPGLWQMVINQLEAGDVSCATLDSCPSDLTGQQVYEILTRNFNRHYRTNRAPFGLHFQASWFDNDDYLTAFQDFLDDVLSKPDVWLLTNSQAISWMRDPVPLKRLLNFRPWRCERRDWRPDELVCIKPETCRLYSRAFRTEIEMQTCAKCPQKYPWVKNEFGLN